MPTSILSIKKVSFSYGDKPVLKNIDLELKPGEVFALIGPNGAGKSTLFRLISGLLPIQTGSIKVNGNDIKGHSSQAKEDQVLLTDNPDIYPYLTGKEFLHMHASLRGISRDSLEKELPTHLEKFPGLANLNNLMGELSRGNKQKIQIISALLAKPKLLMSDEPIVGLDPSSIETFGEIIKSFSKRNSSVLLALHTLEFAQKYADRVGILYNGELVITTDTKSKNLYKLYEKHVS